MRFAHPIWLFGTALALVVAAMLVAGAFLLVRSVRRFGDEARVTALMTDQPAGRRALKGVLMVVAVALGFVALAQPQYGRGTRLVPATNLDVVVALDYSKSMYARDVSPSRTERAKAEVARLIAELPGARFGAVGFAGEPVSFPLTSDGGAIAQFFRQLTPMDMPIGGTAIAKALEAGLDLFRRDPLSSRHKRVLVLVTDGEDLEGDPVTIADEASKEHVTIHVVQIGGRTPEPIPDVSDNGNVTGWRKDSSGQALTTSLSAEGEEQLTKIAQATGGNAVRSERGSTGISEIAASMKKMMTEELSERVETVYADVYLYPTALALLLLAVETFIPESSKRSAKRQRKSGPAGLRSATLAALIAALGCQDGKPFHRHSPVVDDAIHALDAGDPGTAAELLETYLSTGKCEKGEMGAPESVRARPGATFDLGLALFRIAERFGGRFGDDPKTPKPGEADQSEKVHEEVDCALRVVRVAAGDASTPAELRAHAEYLTGNLEFLRGKYEDAVTAYDAAIKLSPGDPKDKDSVGARAAWNRAIALRKADDEKKKKQDGGHPDKNRDGGNSGDSGQPKQSPDGGAPNQNDDQKDKKDDKKDDKGKQDQKDQKDQKNQKDQKDQKDQKNGQEPDQKNQKDNAQARPPPSLSQDERMLDVLEQARTVQQENAKRNVKHGRVFGGMEDK